MSTVRIGILTSGGDTQGINAAVRVIVCAALVCGTQPYAIYEGWQGARVGGDSIEKMEQSDVSSILVEGGTVIDTARSTDFRTYEGRHRVVANLLRHGIDHLVVIGDDGPLPGTSEFRGEWTQRVVESAAEGVVSPETAAEYPALAIVGLVSSTDNDLVGTGMTIGVDTALRRILDIIDQLTSTAASYQHTFVTEVMGRHCGYLPLMAAVVGDADCMLIPEDLADPGWQDKPAGHLRLGRGVGRHEPIILVAEGVHDRDGGGLSTQLITGVIQERTGEDVHVTILGHAQRGGTPSAYDRWISTLLGYTAVQEILTSPAGDEPVILGAYRSRITRTPLMRAVHDTHAVKNLITAGDYTAAQVSHSSSFPSMVGISQILSTPPQFTPEPTGETKRIAVLHTGGLAPGINTAARVVVRLGIARGWTMLGVGDSWSDLAGDHVRGPDQSDVGGWTFKGGAELRTKRDIPLVEQFYALGRAIEQDEVDTLLVIDGMNAYLGVHTITSGKDRYPAFQIPMPLIPASIDSSLPGCELAISMDTTINNVIWAIDRIRESTAASRRCFIAETMGHRCGYLTLINTLSGGAEYMYISGESPSLEQIATDADRMAASSKSGRHLLPALLNESAPQYYGREFLTDVFNARFEGIHDVRRQVLGHMRQGGSPSPYDHLFATCLAAHTLEQLFNQFERSDRGAYYIGQVGSAVETRPVKNMFDDLDIENRHPSVQWWRDLVPIQRIVSLQNPDIETTPIPIGNPVT